MIPEFNEYGYLPPGIHAATIEEIAARFGVESELRRVQTESLRWLVELVSVAAVQRFILNGSFTTDVAEPNDVDCVLLIGSDFSGDSAVDREVFQDIPFLDVHLLELPDFTFFVENLYATDRFFVPKGMVEVVL